MKMSDALRGAAETAPVESVHVSTSTVRSRARRNRTLRGGANGLVGVGAAALVVAGVMGAVANQGGFTTAEGNVNVGTGDVSEPSVGDAAVAPGFDDAGAKAVACGSGLDLSQFPPGDVNATFEDGGIDGSTAQFKVFYETTADGSFTPGAPTAYVLWHDIVVAAGPVVGDSDQLTITADANATRGAGFDLVNCWDGAALPAGDYTIVTVTPVSAAAVDAPPIAEPTAAPSEPAAEPGTVTDDPDTAVSSDATTDIAVAPQTFAVSDAVALTIPGEPVDNPFDEYLKVVDPNPVPTVPAGPDDALTTEEALAAYGDALTTASWDMAPGTHRVVMTSNSDDTNGDLWAQSYYGCPTDGTSTSFPSQSADLNWLDVSAHLPSSVHISYGWIVDGNPLVSYGVTNVSDWSLPGFYEGSSPRFVLVKDGRVVAEAYPVNPDQSGGGIAYATDDTISSGSSDSSGGRDSLIWAPAGDGYLAPGQSQNGDYLWRDVNGCWTNDGQTAISAGTYTVLTAQDIYVGGQYAIAYDGGIAEGGAAADSSKAIAPAPDASGSYASFQVWTSLGTVTITN